MSRDAAARAWWAALAAVVAVSVPLDLWAFVQTRSSEAGVGALVLRHLSYFTVQSNLLVLAAAVPLVRDPHYDGPVWRAVRLASLLGITVTGVVFAVILAPTYHPEGAAVWTNVGLHYAAPLMAVGGWLLFGPWGRTGGGAFGPALAWMAAWVVWTLAHGAATGWYPYFFLDVGVVGYAAALGNVAAIVAGAVVLLLGVRALDQRLGRR